MIKKLMIKKLLADIKKLKAREGYLYAGFPNFVRLFGRDSCISAWQLLRVEPRIAQKTLLILAKYQGREYNQKRDEEPGKILHEHYVGGLAGGLIDFFKRQGHRKIDKILQFIYWDFPYYGAIDSTAWFLILLAEYFKKTRDKKLVKKLWPNVERALSWIESHGNLDEDPFIETERKNTHGLFHQGWKDALGIYIKPPIAMVEVQGYYFLAFKEIGELAKKVMKQKDLKKRLDKKAEKLKKAFNKKFWIKGEEDFVLALSGGKKQIKLATSNPGHLLFTGIIEGSRARKVVKRLFAPDFWTPFGIRTESTKSAYFDPASYHHGSIWPHDNWIIYQGLKKQGFKKEAKKIKEALISAHAKLKRIPELYTVIDGQVRPLSSSCHLQAWATGALVDMLSK